MTIPIPTLSDTNFEDLFKKLRKQIPTHSKEWTDFNYSDPGITFAELFTWLAENKIYSIDQIPEKNYLKFLKLMGIVPKKPIATNTIFQIRKNISDNNIKSVIPKNSILKSKEYVNAEFHTDFDLKPLSVQLGQILLQPSVTSTKFYDPIEGQEQKIDWNVAPFGINKILSSVNDQAFCIGLKISDTSVFPTGIDDVSILHFAVKFEHDNIKNFPIGNHCKDFKLHESNLVEWEYFHGYDSDPSKAFKWKKFSTVDANSHFKLNRHYPDEDFIILDRTNGFTKQGVISLQIPFIPNDSTHDYDFQDITNRNNPKFYWIRFSLKENKLYNNPALLINNLFFNCVSATNGIKVKNEKFFDKNDLFRECKEPQNIDSIPTNKFEQIKNQIPGMINQEIELKNKPIIKINSVKTDDYSANLVHGYQYWKEVDDFENSTHLDNHFVVDYESGIIQFGDGISGKTPPRYSEIIIDYTYGTPKNEIFEDSSFDLQFGDANYNNLGIAKINSIEGKLREDLETTIFRANKELRKPFSAVTLENFEYIAKNTPGLRVARAFALISGENKVSVIVLPYTKQPNPKPTQLFLDEICRHIDQHRLATTAVEVLPPKYVKITVHAKIKGKSEETAHIVKNALDNFLTPISHDGMNKGWIPGRSVYRSEVISVINKAAGYDCIDTLKISASSTNDNLYEIKSPNILINDPQALVYSGPHSIVIDESEMFCMPEKFSSINDVTCYDDAPVCNSLEDSQ